MRRFRPSTWGVAMAERATPILEIRDLNVFYGQSHALQGVNLSLNHGVLSVVGRNGMGKTTVIRALCRLTPPREGRVVFQGRDLAGLPPHRAARAGLGLVPEGRRCFPNLSVAENLQATARPGPWDQVRIEALFPRLAERREHVEA